MNRAALLTLIALVASTQAANAVKVLTPNKDSCAAFNEALEAGSQLNLVLSGWATGFFSGVAQGTGIDYLRNYDVTSPSSAMTLSEFLARAWKAANDKARELGWIV